LLKPSKLSALRCHAPRKRGPSGTEWGRYETRDRTVPENRTYRDTCEKNKQTEARNGNVTLREAAHTAVFRGGAEICLLVKVSNSSPPGWSQDVSEMSSKLNRATSRGFQNSGWKLRVRGFCRRREHTRVNNTIICYSLGGGVPGGVGGDTPPQTSVIMATNSLRSSCLSPFTSCCSIRTHRNRHRTQRQPRQVGRQQQGMAPC
jgi:hypothetical protein